MDIDLARSMITLLSFIAFVGICLWAYSSGRHARFAEAAQLPFAEDDQPAADARRNP